MSATEPKRSKNQSVIMQDKLAANGACKKRTRENFKGLDWFGQSLNLTWNGEDQYKTSFGAGISLVLMIIMLGYSIYRVIYMVNRFNPTVSKTTLIKNEQAEEPFRPQDFGFDFAFGLTKPLDPSIGFFTAKYIEQEVTSQERQKTYSTLELRKCGTDLFNFEKQEDVIKYGISNFQCLVEEDYGFQGNFYRSEMKYLEVKLWKCTNQTKNNTIHKDVVCQNKTVIDAYLATETFSFAFVNSLFATDNYVTPIEHYIDDSLFFELDPGVIQKANFFIQESEASLEDDILQLGQNEEITFHQVQNIRTYFDDYTDKDGYLVAIYMRSDKAFDSYERKVTDILTLMGDIGGLQGSLIAIGVVFVGFITSRMFMSKIIRKIYQIRKYENLEPAAQQQSNSPNHNQNQPSQSNNDMSPDNTNINNYSTSGMQFAYQSKIQNDDSQSNQRSPVPMANAEEDDTYETLDIKQKEQYLQKDFKFKQGITDRDIGSILFAFINRTRFKYTVNNIIEYILGCMCFRRVQSNRRKRQFKKHFLFEKAEEKFMQELDVVRIVKTLRKFKMLAQALLSQKHRLLLRFQRQNLIETSSSSSDSDNNAFDTVRLMENKNPLIRLVMFGKLKKMMSQFKGKQVESLERNMMRGLFIRKIKDFAEDQKEIAENESMLERLRKQMRLTNEEEQQLETAPPDNQVKRNSFRNMQTNHNEIEVFDQSLRSKLSLDELRSNAGDIESSMYIEQLRSQSKVTQQFKFIKERNIWSMDKQQKSDEY